MKFRQSLLSFLLASLLVIALQGTAYAHALPVKTTPADGAIVNTAPTEVTMDTADKMSAKAGDDALIVYDSSNNKITTVDATVDTAGMHMGVPLPASLKPGLYIVRWFTVADEDGENASGSWSFTFDPAQAAKAGAQPKVTSVMASQSGGIPAWTLAVAAVGGAIVGFGAARLLGQARRTGTA